MSSLATRLWIVFCVTIFGMVVANYFGVFAILLAADITRLSFFMISMTILLMLWMTISIWKGHIPDLKPQWFMADNMLTLGMIGTVIGMIYVFSSSGLIGLDFANAASVKGTMVAMVVGVSTKLWTTLVGLVCSTVLKLNLVLVENYQDVEAHRLLQEQFKQLDE